MIRSHLALPLLALATAAPAQSPAPARPAATFANPVDLPYRFALADHRFSKGLSAREAADPSIVLHDGTYWLFASKSGGYWHSKDMLDWQFVKPESFPTEEYAPTVAVVDGTFVLLTSEGTAIYTTTDPLRGNWRKVGEGPTRPDPMLYQDDDGRVYLYWGSSPNRPIEGVELDRKTFAPIGQPQPMIARLTPLTHGWEAQDPLADDATIRGNKPAVWMEAPWMTKHDGRYYLQYSAPGTQLPHYADGTYVADSPLGPYRYAGYSPISYKPSGFITSAGHSTTVPGPGGPLWRVTTMLVGVRYMFERRLGLFPTGFVKTGDGPDQLVTNTYLGDYPQLAPGVAKDPLRDNLAGWMLLSYAKPMRASSTLAPEHATDRASDENIRTWWAAASANPGEWLEVDLGRRMRIDAVQVNFADMNSRVYGNLQDGYRYRITVSDDGQKWRPLVDRGDTGRDAPHDYIQLDAPQTARYARITNVHTPGGAVFSISDLRLFGNALGKAPAKVGGITATRNPTRRTAQVSWRPVRGADFYVVRYGTRRDLLPLNQQVYRGTSATIAALNTDQPYHVTVDAVNGSGIAKGVATVELR